MISSRKRPGACSPPAQNPLGLLYRLGLVAQIVVTVTNIPMAVIFYDLFKVVNRRLALLDLFFTLVATSIETAGLVNQFTPLVLLGSRPYASALPAAQLQALAHLPGDLSAIDYSIYAVAGSGPRREKGRPRPR